MVYSEIKSAVTGATYGAYEADGSVGGGLKMAGTVYLEGDKQQAGKKSKRRTELEWGTRRKPRSKSSC